MSVVKTLRIGAMIMLLGVVIGAFGAHGLKPRLEPSSFSAFKTGVEYHFIHGLALLLLGLIRLHFDEKKLIYAAWSFLAGIICFSGSLYLLSTRTLTGLDWTWLGPITPIGGLFFIIGWLLLFISINDKVLKNDVTK